MSGNVQQGPPPAATPIVGAGGLVTQQWNQWFATQWNRTGGQSGNVNTGSNGSTLQVASASVSSVTTLPPGSSATATASASGGALTLAFGIPAGVAGAPGSPGITAANIGTVNTLPPGSSATASATLAGTNLTLSFGLPGSYANPPVTFTNQALATTTLTMGQVLGRYFHIDNYIPAILGSATFYSESKLAGVFSITSGTNALTNSAANFTPAHTGQTICLPGAGPSVTWPTLGRYTSAANPGYLVAQMTYVSATQVTLSVNASATLTSSVETVSVGTDVSQAFVNAYSDIANANVLSALLEINPGCRYLCATQQISIPNNSGMFCNRAVGIGGTLVSHTGVIVLPPGAPWSAGNPGTGNLWNPMRTTRCVLPGQNNLIKNIEFQAAGLWNLVTASDAEAFAWGPINSMAVNGTAIFVNNKSVTIEGCAFYGFRDAIVNANTKTDSSGNVQAGGGGEIMVHDCRGDNGRCYFIGPGGSVQTVDGFQTEPYINPTIADSSITGWTWPGKWTASTPYSVGQYVQNGSNGYVCTTQGTSAASGGPTGTGSGITDGTVVWNYVANAGFPISDGSGGSIFSLTGAGVTVGSGGNMQAPPVWSAGSNAVVGTPSVGGTLTLCMFDANGPVTPSGAASNSLVGTFQVSTVNTAGFDLHFPGISPTAWYEVGIAGTASAYSIGATSVATVPTNASFVAGQARPGPWIHVQSKFQRLRNLRNTSGNGVYLDGTGPFAAGAVLAEGYSVFDGNAQDMGNFTGGYAYDANDIGANVRIDGLRCSNIFGGLRTRNFANYTVLLDALQIEGASVGFDHAASTLLISGSCYLGKNSVSVAESTAAVLSIPSAQFATNSGVSAQLLVSNGVQCLLGPNCTGAVPNVTPYNVSFSHVASWTGIVISGVFAPDVMVWVANSSLAASATVSLPTSGIAAGQRISFFTLNGVTALTLTNSNWPAGQGIPAGTGISLIYDATTSKWGPVVPAPSSLNGASLPTSLPGTSGQLWNNGGVVCVS